MADDETPTEVINRVLARYAELKHAAVTAIAAYKAAAFRHDPWADHQLNEAMRELQALVEKPLTT